MVQPTNLIRSCFDAHVKDMGNQVFFTFAEYEQFWINHRPGNVYELANRDQSTQLCQVVYFPLPGYKDLRALIEIKIPGGGDLREVPVKFLKLKQASPLPVKFISKVLTKFSKEYNFGRYIVVVTENKITFSVGEGQDKKITIVPAIFNNTLEDWGGFSTLQLRYRGRFGTEIKITCWPPTDSINIFAMIGAGFGIEEHFFHNKK